MNRQAEKLAPQPTIADIAALVEEATAAGMCIKTNTLDCDFGRVPDDIGQHTFTVVREGLTNARKHAPVQPVTLHINTCDDGIRIQISNPTKQSCPTHHSTVGSTAGVGLIGLRERVELAGGTISHGLNGDGHFHLVACLPLTNGVSS